MTPSGKESRAHIRLLSLFIMSYITAISLLCCLKYLSFQYIDFDLAVHTQSLHNLLNGSVDCSILGIPFPGNHMALSLLLVAPFYLLFPSPATLLIFQTVILSAGALAVFSYAARHLRNPLPVILAGLYLLYPPLIYMNLYEFHPVALATTFLLFALLAYDRKDWLTYTIFIVLAMACQENIALIVIMMGIKALIDRRRAIWSVVPVIAGTAWFLACVLLIMPKFNPGIMRFDSIYGHMGDSLPEIAKYIILNPVDTCRFILTQPNLLYLLSLLLPLALTSLLAPAYLLPVLPVLAQRLLSARDSETTILFHYQAEMIPFIFVSAIHGMKRLEKILTARWQNIAIISAAVMTIFCFAISGLPQTFISINQQAKADASLNQIRNSALTKIQPQESVAATFRYLPRLAARRSLHSLHHIYTGYYTLSSQPYPMPYDLSTVILDKNDPLTFGASGFFTQGGHTNVENMLRLNNMQPVINADPVFLLKRSADPTSVPDPTPPKDSARLPGITRQQDNVFLMENHCNALIAWHASGITNSVLVHIDTHDDFRRIADGKLALLQNLLAENDYLSSFLNSDTSQFLNMKRKGTDLLYDLGNFIYPCMKLGMFSEIYWVVPERVITSDQNLRLKKMIAQNLPASQFEDIKTAGGGFKASVGGVPFTVLPLDDLPSINKNVLLDIDVDFFAFPVAMTETHLIGEFSRDPEEVLAILDKQVKSPSSITISASVWGGYLPLIDRFLADAIYDYYTTGAYPEDARQLSRAISEFKSGHIGTISQPHEESVFFAAWSHINALRQLSTGNSQQALESISAAAKSNPVYLKGLLDMAEALLAMQMPDKAVEFIDIFESSNEGPSYNSLAVRAMALMDAGATGKALAISSELTAWEQNPYTLLIHGAALNKADRKTEASACFNDIIKIKPDSAIAHYNLGVIAESGTNTAKAVEHYSRAIEYGRNCWQAYENLGFIMLKQKEFKSAEELLKHAVAINPFSVTSVNNLGLSLANQGKLEEAEPIFRKALTLSPDNSTIKQNLADTIALQRDRMKGQ